MDRQVQLEQFALVGKLSLWFSLVALIGLLVVVWFAGSTHDDYFGQIQNLALARKNLPLIMLSGGLLLALGTGLTTWVIVLYSSFRVAGPLYRFALNLEAGVAQGEVPRIPIRENDLLQAENKLLQDTVARLYQHYGELDKAAEQALALLDSQALSAEPSSAADLELAISRLCHLETQARYD